MKPEEATKITLIKYEYIRSKLEDGFTRLLKF